MKIREATAEDEALWDAFVDAENGNFHHYINWRHFYEIRNDQYIPLLVEREPGELIGILPIVKEKRRLYSVLTSFGGGLLLKNDLSDAEKREATTMLIKYLDTHYSSGCSRIEVSENLPLKNQQSEEPTPVLIENGFRFRYDKLTRLPCQFVIELKQPFEEHIWKGLWSGKMRQKINKVKRSGVVVVQDRESKYTDEYMNMLRENYKRHETRPPTREQIKIELDTFKNKGKFFVALLNERPVVILLCYYHVSTCRMAKIGLPLRDTENINLLCYAEAIEDACNMGYKYADLTVADTPGLAYFKERFRGTRIPYRIYDKRYSFLRYLIEMAPVALQRIRHDKTYFWKYRRRLLDRIIHG